MAITAGITTAFKQASLSGKHLSTHAYKIALYPSSATIGPTTVTYSPTGECPGTGNYTQGGTALSGFAVTLDGTTAILDFTSDPSWSSSTITARGALIWNTDASFSGVTNTVCVLDFGSDIVSTNGTFTVTIPAATAAAGLVRIA